MKLKPIVIALGYGSVSVAMLALSAQQAQADTMYNPYGTKGQFVDPWVGTTNGSLPFGYNGNQNLNWAVLIDGNDPVQHKLTISEADALTKYNTAVTLDVGRGAWFDGTTPGSGWGHTVDFGLFKSSVDTNLTISAKSLIPGTKLGFTLFTGMDSAGSSYGRHRAWNTGPGYQPAIFVNPRTNSNPFGTTGVNYLAHAAPDEGNYNSATGETTYTLPVVAGQVYSLYIGGSNTLFSSPGAGPSSLGYQVSFTPSQVPLPAAAWLMGGGLITLFAAGRKKTLGA